MKLPPTGTVVSLVNLIVKAIAGGSDELASSAGSRCLAIVRSRREKRTSLPSLQKWRWQTDVRVRATNVFFVLLSGCLPKILITQIGHKIDFLQILYVNCTLSGYFKNTFRLGSKCFLRQLTRGVPWWTKTEIILVQKCQFSITLVTPHST